MQLAGDGLHISEYDPSLADAILGEAAFLLRAIGFAAHHTILIGGLVPGLLVLDPGPGRPAHVGTADIDLCLSVALVEGDTAEYERIEAALKKADYKLTEDTFCWRRASGLRLKVEFFLLDLLGLVVRLSVQPGKEVQDGVREERCPAEGETGQRDPGPAVTEVGDPPARPHVEVHQPGQCDADQSGDERPALPDGTVAPLARHRHTHDPQAQE